MLLMETFQMEVVKEAMLYFYADIEICVPLNWKSKRIGRVVQSSLATESLTLSDALDYFLKLYLITAIKYELKYLLTINRFMNHYFQRKI